MTGGVISHSVSGASLHTESLSEVAEVVEEEEVDDNFHPGLEDMVKLIEDSQVGEAE